MMGLSLSQVAQWTDGVLLQGVPGKVLSSVSTDSRKISQDQLFVALKGDRFDAHDYIGEVGDAGAAGMMVSELNRATERYEGAIIHVKDSLKALQNLAFHHRQNSPDLFVVGVTGSNGKTSTKDFLGAVLSEGGQVVQTAGNLNNHIGLPLTILSGAGDEKFGVWEMGMNHPGEIEVLAEIARPNAAVITHIGRAHIEYMKTREAIAAEKCELALAVPSDGYCVMPVNDDYFGFVSDRVSCEMISVGICEGDIRAENVRSGSGGVTRFELHSKYGAAAEVCLSVKGQHMIVNALLAAAVGLRHGISQEQIASQLSSVELTGGRLQERHVGGFCFIDDSYNANPDSMLAALETVRNMDVTGRRVAVLGFMGELGDHEEAEYAKLGASLAGNCVDALVTVGDRAALINSEARELNENHNFSSHREAAEFLESYLTPDDLVLVKGSRGAAMEKVIENVK
tara:strand:+ start:534 stop:1901 length:1368 start_codon:yes stop_codon:yes gene_type:complete